MIQSIATKYKKHIAYSMLILFYLQTIILPMHAVAYNNIPVMNIYNGAVYKNTNDKPFVHKNKVVGKPTVVKNKVELHNNKLDREAYSFEIFEDSSET